jgi:hypothetical protein
VIESCCPEFAEDLVGRLGEQCPHDPLAAEDLLYQLCVEVNPHFDIHTVRLADRVRDAPDAERRPSRKETTRSNACAAARAGSRSACSVA